MSPGARPACRHAPSLPAGRLEMEVEPPEQDLVRRQSEELLQCLVLVQQAVQLGVQLDVDLAEQPAPNDLPDQAVDQVLAALGQVRRANVDNRAADALGGGNDDIVVLGHLEVVQAFGEGRRDADGRDPFVAFPARARGLVEDALVDGVGDRVVDELGEDEAVCVQARLFAFEPRCGSCSPLHSSKICMVSVGMGMRSPMSASPARTCRRGSTRAEGPYQAPLTELMCRVNSTRSSSLTVWLELAVLPPSLTLPALDWASNPVPSLSFA
jgi:hypothetical protein